MTEKSEALRLADALANYTGCTLAQMDQAAAELRRLHAELVEYERWADRDEARAANAERERDIAEAERDELGAALRRLISYCNTLENRLMEADGEHPALQEAKEALQREKA
jgi:DNA repair exonuclease SbcCD ATPase subunit